jgi:hypothetical protein
MIFFIILTIIIIVILIIEIKEFRKAPIKLDKEKLERENDVKAMHIILELANQHHSTPKFCDQYKGGPAPGSNNPPPNTGNK